MSIQTERHNSEPAVVEASRRNPSMADFWEMTRLQRKQVLLEAIQTAHAWHFERNKAYRTMLASRRAGSSSSAGELPLLLRPTAQTFKSYIDILGTPFPNEFPRPFLEWLADQLSIELPRERFDLFNARYPNLESFLHDIESIYRDFGLEILTSSGTSGRSTILVRDQDAIQKTVESFYNSFRRYFGMQVDHRVIFIMPRQTRIAMARMAGFSLSQMGIPNDRFHFTIPFPAFPDQVRVRAGQTFKEGWRGTVERRLGFPFMNWMNEHAASPYAVRKTVQLLRQAQAAGDKVLLFGSWIHLHAVAIELHRRGLELTLAAGSVLGSGGGFKELYPFTTNQITADLARVIRTTSGEPVPLRDVYGMAEANWAAMQCVQGSYHIPPWVLAVTLDDDDRILTSSGTPGLLAFFDPVGGGDLFPAFFRTTDRVRLVNGLFASNLVRKCPCGEPGEYIEKGSIQRVDLLDEAGCAAQI